MGNLKLKGKDLLKMGYPNNQSINIALEVMKRKNTFPIDKSMRYLFNK